MFWRSEPGTFRVRGAEPVPMNNVSYLMLVPSVKDTVFSAVFNPLAYDRDGESKS